MSERVTALRYQKEGVWAIERFGGRALLADEMGLGKTNQALWWLRRNNDATSPTIIICPASVKAYWEREAYRQVGLRAEVIEGRTPPVRYGLLRQRRLVIINYELLDPWLGWLLGQHPQAVVIDEVQNIQNRDAARTKATVRLCRDVPYILGLSGTPLTNRPAELYTILSILWPEVFNSFLEFAMRYCDPQKKPWGWEYKGATNLGELHGRLRELGMIRRLKTDVLGDLPPVMREVIPMPLADEREYRKAENEFIQWVAENYDDKKAARAAKAERLVKMGYLKRLAAKLKMRAAVRWIDDYLANSDDKLCLFAWHNKCIEALHRRYKNSVVINGATPAKTRLAAIDQFRYDPQARVFIGNLQAGGTGIDGLQYACNTGVVLELDWRPGIMNQMEARLDRMGQQGAAWWYYLIATNTIEDYLCEILQKKKAVIGQVLDGKADSYDFEIYDLLQAKITGSGHAKPTRSKRQTR